VSRTPHRLHNPTQDSILKMAQRLSLLLSFRILYTAVSFGPTLGSDVSTEYIGVSRTSFTLINLLKLQVTFLTPCAITGYEH
jgi:hypothetical protein